MFLKTGVYIYIYIYIVHQKHQLLKCSIDKLEQYVDNPTLQIYIYIIIIIIIIIIRKTI